MNEDFVEAVLAVVDDIPPGRVMSYGQVAASIGSRSARGVGRVMSLYGSTVPWWRVVQASGKPPTCHENTAREHYDAEGTPVAASGSGYKLTREAFVR
ncbi:Alkylated DNA nucleotide flippase Atl1, participates in nucleotide excision repair, Ada-like DNA-binding domain [Paramicrobacterium humi]|uniref:Alkylated DNA nucleotide flippase Atl1, participates in nucleotide excision repair, Ada-like DNA-binding domain n=1 Tax=Paramicrobacterium humi TaxID=640635 RepID=A0A1H4IWQ5_9MICO|nr:MGMT family protein [Microbacterium humi]SEB38530.1 Alkylated DNA nucleotide flippase Atl1, participates in nucleotide excision repair, Ada-like DNA-binding domain [Microbacterium humi]